MSNQLDIDAARKLFASAIMESDFVPDSAEISIRDDASLGEAAAIHCKWPLVEKGPHSGNYSREITVQITSGAMNRFRSAEPLARGDMLTQFGSVFNARYLDGQYNALDSTSPPFIIHIDEDCF